MNKYDLFLKSIKVFESCNDEGQFAIACKWFILAVPHLDTDMIHKVRRIRVARLKQIGTPDQNREESK